MTTSFNRLRTQEQCERLVGCTILANWGSYKEAFENLTLTSQQEISLKAALREDARDLYYKGLLSLSEAIYAMGRHLYSWATVKAYYSVFYMLRSSLALRGHAIVRADADLW